MRSPLSFKKELALDVRSTHFYRFCPFTLSKKIQLSCAFQGGDNADCDDPFDKPMNLFDS